MSWTLHVEVCLCVLDNVLDIACCSARVCVCSFRYRLPFLFFFLCNSPTASSERQAHGIRQLADADGDDVDAVLALLSP